MEGVGLVLNVAWRWVTVPVDLHRKVFSNYWAITSLGLSGKDYAKVLERRLRLIVKPWIQKGAIRILSWSWNSGRCLPLQGNWRAYGLHVLWTWRRLLAMTLRVPCGGYCRCILSQSCVCILGRSSTLSVDIQISLVIYSVCDFHGQKLRARQWCTKC